MGTIPCDIVLREIFLRQDFLLPCQWPANPRDLSQPDSQHGCYKCTTVYINLFVICWGGGGSCKCESQSLCLAFLGGGPGIKLISSCLHSKLSTDWHIFPDQPLVFLSCEASLRTLTTVEYSHLYTVFPPSVLASNLYRTEVPVW